MSNMAVSLSLGLLYHPYHPTVQVFTIYLQTVTVASHLLVRSWIRPKYCVPPLFRKSLSLSLVGGRNGVELCHGIVVLEPVDLVLAHSLPGGQLSFLRLRSSTIRYPVTKNKQNLLL